MKTLTGRVAAIILLLFGMALAGCQPSQPEDGGTAIPPLESVQPPTLQAVETNTAAPTLTKIPTKEPIAYFTVAVIVDTTSEVVTREQVDAVMAEDHANLQYLTGFGLQVVDYLEGKFGPSIDVVVNDYMVTTDMLPNGIIIFSYGDDNQAKLYGGYARQFFAPSGFQNSFVSPLYGADRIYVGVIHFGHKYAACGYAGKDTVQSAVSSNGECRGVDGVSCVEHNGYSMCPDATQNLYASTITYFAASSVVHEIMHSFGEHGVDDHFGTAACLERMGWSGNENTLERSQRFNGMCPYVYDNFKAAYQPGQ